MVAINVYFRKFEDGDVIALWDDNTWNMRYMCSYQHIGQHSEADASLVHELEKADYLEYEDLMKEMQSIGYNITVLR